MCLLDLCGVVSVIIYHHNYFVAVACGTHDKAGLMSKTGMPVLVFNTCLYDLMLHIKALRKCVETQRYGICSLSVKALEVGGDLQSDHNITFGLVDEDDSFAGLAAAHDVFQCNDAIQ